jgi:uncharacterized membrane protein YfcA
MIEAFLGLGIGALLGLLGAGGSILAVPALVYGAAQPLAVAVPTSLLVVGVSSATAALSRIRAGQVQWRIGAIVAAAGVPVTFLGTALNRALPPDVVLAGFALLMAAAGSLMLRGGDERAGSCARRDGQVNWRACLPKAVTVGAAVGFLTGLFGIGGGFLLIPSLTLLLGLAMPVATGTSLLIITANSAAGFLAYAAHDSPSNPGVEYRTALVFTVAAVVGSLVTARLARRLPAERLRRWFAYLVLVVAAFVAVRSLTG